MAIIARLQTFWNKRFSQTWQDYLRGQGTVLFCSLLGGILFPWIAPPLASYVGSYLPENSRQDHGTVRRLNLNAKQPTATEVWEPNTYSHFTVFMKTMAPEGKTSHVAIYGSQQDGTSFVMKRLESPAASWVRWQQAGPYSRLHLALEDLAPESTKDAVAVEVLLYLHR